MDPAPALFPHRPLAGQQLERHTMKKLATLAALAALALPVIATEVTSSNVVGYNKLTLQPGYNLIGSQFVLIGGETKDINEFLETDANLNTLPGLDGEGGFQTTLRTWGGTETGYVTYGWLDADDGTANEVPEWNSKWILYSMEDIATVPTPVGEGYWIKSTGTPTITFVGQVPDGDTGSNNTKTLQVSAGYNLIANPFPCAINIQNIQSATLPGLSQEGAFQTMIRLWGGEENGYVTYGWLDADDGTENEVPDWNSKWILYSMEDLANVTIGVGEGFWLYSETPATVTFSK